MTGPDAWSALWGSGRDELGGATVLSRHQPEDVSFDEPFDAVLAHSFFSHMPIDNLDVGGDPAAI
jgi:hypothetical protein